MTFSVHKAKNIGDHWKSKDTKKRNIQYNYWNEKSNKEDLREEVWEPPLIAEDTQSALPIELQKQ